MSKVSVFQNISPKSYRGDFTDEDVLTNLRSAKYKAVTETLRSIADPKEAKEYKAGIVDEKGHLETPGHFYGVTWAGTFHNGKKATDLVQLSGLICMDIDGLTAPEVARLFEQLRGDECTFVCFISPSGFGLKWVVRIDIEGPEQFKPLFAQLSDYLHECYGLTRKADVPKGTKPQIDPSGCNVDRLCFLPYAPDAFHNPNSSTVPLLPEYQPAAEVNSAPPRTPPTLNYDSEDNTLNKVADCVQQIKRQGIDITAPYEDWVKIGMSLASLGEAGRDFFHAVSAYNSKYQYGQANAKFDEFLRNGRSVNIGTFFFVCEQNGITPTGYGAANKGRSEAYSNYKPDSATDADWQTPVPLNSQLLPVLPLTRDMLPSALQDWVFDIADRMKCPPDYPASCAIVLLSSLVGTRLSIRPKSLDNWTIVPNLWGAAIGRPSAKKTPPTTHVLAPLHRLEKKAFIAYKEKKSKDEEGQIIYDVQKKLFTKQQEQILKGETVEKPVSLPVPLTLSTEKRYLITDATVEKVVEILAENPQGLLQYRDELISFFAKMERPGHESDRGFYLQAATGNIGHRDDRITRNGTPVENVCISLFGTIQPAKLLPYLQAATGIENDGFIQRIQLAVFPDRATWEYVDQAPDENAQTRAYDLIDKLAEADLSSWGDEANEYEKFSYMRFDSEAQNVFREWSTVLNSQKIPNESGLLEEHLGKFDALMPSLALIFHVTTCIDTNVTIKQVSKDAALLAQRWCDYLESHARRIYGLLDTAGINAAKELLRHIKAGHLHDGFKNRDVVKKKWTGLTTPADVDAALGELVAHHYLHEVEPAAPDTGRPPAPYYVINPTILQKA